MTIITVTALAAPIILSIEWSPTIFPLAWKIMCQNKAVHTYIHNFIMNEPAKTNTERAKFILVKNFVLPTIPKDPFHTCFFLSPPDDRMSPEQQI